MEMQMSLEQSQYTLADALARVDGCGRCGGGVENRSVVHGDHIECHVVRGCEQCAEHVRFVADARFVEEPVDSEVVYTDGMDFMQRRVAENKLAEVDSARHKSVLW